MHRRSTITALLFALALTGCGAHGPAGSTGDTARAAVPAARALTQADVMSVRLRSSRAQTLARLGPPSASGPRTVGTYRCLYWQIANQPPTALWRLCFRSGRLQVLSTYLS